MRIPEGFKFITSHSGIVLLVREDAGKNPLVYGAGRDDNPTTAQNKAIARFYSNWKLVDDEWQLKESCRD